MADNLAERLRKQANHRAQHAGDGMFFFTPADTLEWQAAERIDALRAREKVLTEALRTLKRAVSTEVILHGAGCSGGYLKAEALAIAALAALK